MAMATERVTVTIRPSAGEAGLLRVQDAMHQILDFFDLLSAAGGEDSKAVSWRLVDVSMASPLTATAEAFSDVPGVQAEMIARREKGRLVTSIREITESRRIPAWMDSSARAKARALFNRNLNEIGRTDIKFDEQTPITIISERSARTALVVLDSPDKAQHGEDDLSRSEMGSVEGSIIRLETYHGRPSIRLAERVTDKEISCILSPSLAQQIGPQHNWTEVWVGRRVLVVGEIFFGSAGQIARVYATDVRPIDARRLSYSDIADRNFTNGLSVREYLNNLWEDDIG